MFTRRVGVHFTAVVYEGVVGNGMTVTSILIRGEGVYSTPVISAAHINYQTIIT